MSKHIEMIEDYIIKNGKGTDYNPPSYEWSDNHGILTRCKDCKRYCSGSNLCVKHVINVTGYDYCSKAVREDMK